MKNKNIIFYIVAFAVVFGCAYFIYQNYQEVEPKNPALSEVDKPAVVDTPNTEENKDKPQEKPQGARDFSMIGEDDKILKLSDVISQGKPIVLNFWASWCGNCMGEMDDFQAVWQDYKDDVNFVMLDMVDYTSETLEKGRAAISENNLTMPFYFDTMQQAAASYGITGVPLTVFIDADGNEVTGILGAMDEKKLRKAMTIIWDDEAEAPVRRPEYRKIDAEKAKEMIDVGGVTIVDVRNQDEYDSGHIENAVLIPQGEVEAKAAEALPNKNKPILVYCRSGVRSEEAARELVKKGYTNVYDFGGIIDWPYDVVK